MSNIALLIFLIALVFYVIHRIRVNKDIFEKHRRDIECCPRCGSTRIRYNQPRDRVTNSFQHKYDYWDRHWHRDRYIESQDGYYQCNRCGKKWG